MDNKQICEKEGEIKKLFCLTIPSFILNVEHCSGKSWCAGAFWYSGVVKVTQLGLALSLRVAHVLAEHHI